MSDEEAPSTPRGSGRRTWLRKKAKRRLMLVAIVALGIIYFRGLTATTKNSFTCDFKMLYAICSPKFKNAQFPGLWDIIKAGAEFK